MVWQQTELDEPPARGLTRPLLLDLFCGAGGAAMGYYRAGFDVVGVDMQPQPRYPFRFIQSDAMTFPLDECDVIHASPICQDYSTGNTWLRAGRERKEHTRLIVPIRERLAHSGKPWVVENVRLALDDMLHPLQICGTALGLRVQRHRLFDSNYLLFAPGPCRHRMGDLSIRTHRVERLRTGHGLVRYNQRGEPYQRNEGATVAEARKAMEIDWMTQVELGEAIPPAYTEWIGRQLLSQLESLRRVS